MGVGMVKQFEGAPMKAMLAPICVAAAMCFACVDVGRAQTPPLTTTTAEESGISKECKTPTMALRGDVPLPAVSMALQERKEVNIFTIGGTARAGADPQSGGYNAVIERLLETSLKGVQINMMDQGISGELVRDAAERIKTYVALNRPDLVIWQAGTSDAFSHIPPDEFEAALTETVRWLKHHNTDVVLVGVHYIRNLASDANYQAIRGIVNKVAMAEKVLRIGRYEAGEWLEKSKSQTDEFAMTEAGYTCMAEYLARAISGALIDAKWRVKPPS